MSNRSRYGDEAIGLEQGGFHPRAVACQARVVHCLDLRGVTAVEWRIVKALARALDRLPKVVSGGIDICRTN